MEFVTYSDWVQLPERAEALFTQAEKSSIFFSRQWFENLTTEIDDDQSIMLACVIADNQVMAILPLVMSAGKTGYALKHRYTPVYSLLLAHHDQAGVLSCLVQGLTRLPLTGLLLEPVADNDNNLLSLQREMEAAGFSCDRMFRFYNWFLRVQGQSYEEYMAARPAKLRNTILRKQRKLDREHGYTIRLFSGDDVPGGMADYYAVYNASWKATEQYVDFVDAMVARFTQAGWTRLAVLYAREQPVAAQLWFVHQGKASIFRLSYDEKWKAYSPGSILTSFLMEYVIDTDKVDEVDFLFGNDAYKQDWMSDRRERFALSCVRSDKQVAWYKRFIVSLRHMLQRR